MFTNYFNNIIYKSFSTLFNYLVYVKLQLSPKKKTKKLFASYLKAITKRMIFTNAIKLEVYKFKKMSNAGISINPLPNNKF